MQLEYKLKKAGLDDQVAKQKEPRMFISHDQYIPRLRLEHSLGKTVPQETKVILSCHLLHLDVLTLLVSLLLESTRGTLDPLYCSRLPSLNAQENTLSMLHSHVNRLSLPFLHQWYSRVQVIRPRKAALRMLRLMYPYFQDIYESEQKIDVGAYGRVYGSQAFQEEDVAVK